ncbi:transcriptional regulator [Pseudomonas protegens]|nr:transcriptional regulator [Pseudomonas protegens]
MNRNGNHLHQEREWLGMPQAVFGELGGVKANAQDNYEKGDRFPDAAWLGAVAGHDVDVLYVVIDERSLVAADSITADESTLLTHYRQLPESDHSHTCKMVTALAEMAKKIY